MNNASNSVFLDTSAFVALNTEDDESHLKSLSVRDNLAKRGVVLVTTEAILFEFGNTFSHTSKRSTVVNLYQSMMKAQSIGRAVVVPFDQKFREQTWTLFKNYSDKNWGLVDCFSFAVMKEMGITEAFTADRHFEQAGFIKLI